MLSTRYGNTGPKVFQTFAGKSLDHALWDIFLMPGVPPGAPCPIPHLSLAKVVQEEYTLYYTQAAGVLKLAYTCIKLYTQKFPVL